MIVSCVHINEMIGCRYDFSYITHRQCMSKFKFPIAALSDLLKRPAQYGACETGINRNNNKIARYIRITDITEDGLLLNNLGVTANRIEDKYLLNDNDLLIARSGNTVGKSYIHKSKNISYPCFFAGYMIRFVVNETQILSDYLFVYTQLSIYKRWVKAIQRTTGQPNINAEEYGNLPISLPPIEVQKQIVELYTQAQEAKQAKGVEAKSLLESINTFLLEVLDIASNQQYEKKSIFSTTISNLIGQRFDVSSYKEHFEMISNKYPNRRLSSLVEIDPAIKFSALNKDTTISFIPMECIDEKYGEISEQREISISQIKGYTKFEEGDLLWAKITPCMQNGKSAIARHLKNGVGCGSTEYYVIRPKTEDLLIDYVYLMLRHPEVLKSAQSSFGGSAGQQRVSPQYIKSIVIPYPSKDIQQSIVDVIFERKQRAKQLQKEGAELLEQAKQEIEKRILG